MFKISMGPKRRISVAKGYRTVSLTASEGSWIWLLHKDMSTLDLEQKVLVY